MSRAMSTGRINSSAAARKALSSVNFRLPQLNIPAFSGKFVDWMSFKDLFVTTVHSQNSLSNIQKFQYLKVLHSDEPASLMKHIPLSYYSYEVAWGKLKGRFDEKNQIVRAIIKTFKDQKSISQANVTNLRNLVDTNDEVLRGLNALGTETTSRDPWLMQLLLQKLDPETKRLCSVKTADIDFSTLKEFIEFLNIRFSHLDLMICKESDTKLPTK
ncbi:hypothetical protein AVEN_216490-1 [Araneus ventricosus]|uniref:Uncharacterized protein n=1 Tax=Araneus ventricosus TaxID=182803 RepID=A0A4Y2BLK9_ARAVE|nr:hypothetical protein AVEN_216490-1 [Araneus ventricosus]